MAQRKPYNRSPRTGHDGAGNNRGESRLAQCHVLLAEDNVVNQQVAVALLEKCGITVSVALNGKEAIDQVLGAKPGKFDVVLMDMDMPEVDGYQATLTIKGTFAYRQLPIIALTAHNTPEVKARCMDCGMSQFLSKPVKPHYLYDAILGVLPKMPGARTEL